MITRIFVPRFFDAGNHNAQNLNAKAILAHAGTMPHMQFLGIYYGDPVELPRNVRLTRLWRGVLFKLHLILLYQGRYDAIFYPGKESFDRIGLLLRKLTGRRIPVIATFEGMAGDEAREQELGRFAGHEVFCNRMPPEQLRNFDFIRYAANHVVAISPFLSKVGCHLYGDKFSVIPLGINRSLFYCSEMEKKSEQVTVVCSGTVYERKRPELFVELAKRLPEAQFTWYGGGPQLEEMRGEVEGEGSGNIEFVGPVDHHKLAEAFRHAHLFVLPSLSEGVPKVSQEAAACGLPLVMFGFFEAPSLLDGKNGCVVWSDEEFIGAVASLTRDRKKLDSMGAESARMAANWSWEIVAEKWLTQINHCLDLQK